MYRAQLPLTLTVSYYSGTEYPEFRYAYIYRGEKNIHVVRNAVSLLVAIALPVRAHSRQPLSPMPIPCTGAWLSRVPRRDVTAPRAQTLRLLVVRSPRLCGFCLSRSAAPAPLELAATYVLTHVHMLLSRVAPRNTRCTDSVRPTECLRLWYAPSFVALIIVASYITCTEDNLFSKLSFHE